MSRLSGARRAHWRGRGRGRGRPPPPPRNSRQIRHSTIGCIHAALILHSTIGCIHAALSDPLGRILASSALISGFEVPIPTICATHALLVLAILALHRAHASTTASNAQYPCTMILDLARQCVSRQCERRLQGWERGEGGTLSVSDCVVQLHSALSQCVMGRAGQE